MLVRPTLATPREENDRVNVHRLWTGGRWLQLERGRLTMPRLISAGDAVCTTTTPNFERGITTSLLQAQELLPLVDEHGDDAEAVG